MEMVIFWVEDGSCVMNFPKTGSQDKFALVRFLRDAIRSHCCSVAPSNRKMFL